ncbi:Site-specific recombinase XerD [Methanophagales archaeon]|nr:Site-specific recombinase XerD [Methanophagales archaeon]
MTPMEEEATEKLVESFYNYQKQEKGLSEETASVHADHIRLFALHYLPGYAERNLLEVTDRDIDDYLSNWYIRKVWNSCKSDVRPILTAFKKFYMFLHECGRVDKDQLDEILLACKNPRRYIRRFESHDELDPDSETWDIDYEVWFMDEYDEEELEVNYEQPFEVNEKISTAFSKDDLSLSRTTVLNDFQTFLNYLLAHNGMKLTAANSFISRRDLFALNEAMNSPEELKNTANQPDSRTIHLFYTLSKTLNLLVVSANNKLAVTPRIDRFKQLSQKEQFVVLFDALWNETRWGKILPPDSGGSQESVREERGNIASALSECEVDEKYQFVDWIREFCRVPGSAEDELSLIIGVAVYLFSVFEARIVPALTIFGLLDFGFEKDRKEYLVNHGLGIEWFTITKLGQKIFRGIGTA